MKRKLQVILTDETTELVENLMKEANENYDSGTITYSDLLNEMILNAKIDIKNLQIKHADLRRSLRALALRTDLDLDMAIKTLNEFRGKSTKRRSASTTEEAS